MTSDAAATFHALHTPGRPLLLPNAWDYATAAHLIAAGFDVMGTTSLGVAAAHGLPDARGAARDETVALARMLGTLPCLYTVDIEAGFSDDAAEVAELVAHLSELGAVGINLEDGRADGTLADPKRQGALIRAIKDRAPAVFLNARIDTYWLQGGTTAETLARAERYLAAGADGIFVPGIAADGDIETVVSAIPAPVNVLYLPGKHSLVRLAGLGVSRISMGSLLFRTALHAVVETASAIRDGKPLTALGPAYDDIQRSLLRGAPRLAGPSSRGE